jgi:hypothetical protein
MSIAVYKAINAVQSDLSEVGIAKNKRNTQGSGYNFRGIDDVYNAIAPLLAKHGLCIIPRMLARTSEERQSKSGGALFYVTVEAEFDFVSAEDGSKHTARTFGEAMDSGDKATNKAMSAAYKYAAFQTFAIPTEGNPDADAETHEVRARHNAQRAEWLAEQRALIFGAKTGAEFKQVVAQAVNFAMQQNDNIAVDLLNEWAAQKSAQAKPKTNEAAA